MGRLSLGQCSGVITFRSLLWRYLILLANRNEYLGGSSEPRLVLWRDYVPLTGLAVYNIISQQKTYLGGSSEPGPMLWEATGLGFGIRGWGTL